MDFFSGFDYPRLVSDLVHSYILEMFIKRLGTFKHVVPKLAL
jgi:hypothetical protein